MTASYQTSAGRGGSHRPKRSHRTRPTG